MQGERVPRLLAVRDDGEGADQLGIPAFKDTVGVGTALEIVLEHEFRRGLAVGLWRQRRAAAEQQSGGEA